MNTNQNKTNTKWTGLALAGILALAGLGFTVRAVSYRQAGIRQRRSILK